MQFGWKQVNLYERFEYHKYLKKNEYRKFKKKIRQVRLIVETLYYIQQNKFALF